MILVLHLSSLLLGRLRTPAPGEDYAAHLDHAVSAAVADVDRLFEEAHADAVLAVLPGRGEPMRRSLATAWTTAHDEGGRSERPPETWAALDRLAGILGDGGAELLAAAPWPAAQLLDLGGGEAASVSGLVPSSRDVIATLVAEHRARADGSGLRLVTTRPSVAALLDPQASVDLALLIDGRWQVVSEGKDLAAWARWPGADAKIRVPRALLPDYEALAAVEGVGEKTAVGLLRGDTTWRGSVDSTGQMVTGSALLAVVRAAEAGERLAIPQAQGRSRAVATAIVDRIKALGQRGARELLAVYRLHPCGYAPAKPRHGAGVAVTEDSAARHAVHTEGADVSPCDGCNGSGCPSCMDAGPPTSVAELPTCGRCGCHMDPGATIAFRGERLCPTCAALAARFARVDAPQPRPAPRLTRPCCDAWPHGSSKPCVSPYGPGAPDRATTPETTAAPRPQPRPTERQTMSDNRTALARQSAPSGAMSAPGDFGPEHMRIVRDAFAPTASQAEFEVMWAGAKARGLDPVKKQIYFIKRYDMARGEDVWASQVSIDGFRSIAASSALYDGQDEPEYEYDGEGRVTLARVRVYRKGVSRPFVGVARWNEYVQTKKNGDPTHMWRKMEHTMLGKCAEALGLRKAFPELLSGLHTSDEMDQAANEAEPVPRPEPKAPPQLPVAVLTAKALLDRIPRAEDSTAIFEIVKAAPTWPKVRGHAWLRLLALSTDAAEVEQTRTLFASDDLPPDVLAKLEEAAATRLSEVTSAAA